LGIHRKTVHGVEGKSKSTRSRRGSVPFSKLAEPVSRNWEPRTLANIDATREKPIIVEIDPSTLTVGEFQQSSSWRPLSDDELLTGGGSGDYRLQFVIGCELDVALALVTRIETFVAAMTGQTVGVLLRTRA
jgi:hypothetical protein